MSDTVWEQLLPRNDDQIGMQELLAIPLAFESFRDLMDDALWLLAVDNQGVLHALVSGRSAAADVNSAVGRIWLDMAKHRVALHVVRVESAANIADGPTRESTELLEELGAIWVPPRLPQWVTSLWDSPQWV